MEMRKNIHICGRDQDYHNYLDEIRTNGSYYERY